MNPYSSPRQMSANYATSPFYNPQKEPINHSIQISHQRELPTTQFGSTNQLTTGSKSYIVKSNHTETAKSNNNNSGYFKNSHEGYTIGNKHPSSNGNPTSFINFNQTNYSKNITEMAKSSFHDTTKTSESFIGTNHAIQKPSFVGTTPPRRAPRMSEPAMQQDPMFQQPTNEPKTIPNFLSNANIYKQQQKQKQSQVHFYKTKPQFSPYQQNLNVDSHEKKEQKVQFNISSKKQISTFKTDSPWTYKKKKVINVDIFEKIKNLGAGKYGQVFLVRQKSSGFVCALKVIEKKLLVEENITDQFIRQLKIQMFLNHPNIIKLYGFFDDETHIYIILQVGNGGQLYHQLKKSQPMTEAKTAGIMKQVCAAVDELHSQRIIHRDIKPENIVIHDNIIKLCDFGWSVHLDNKMRTTFCGTPLYVCPEILKGNQYDEKIDIWSLGIMMYEMLVGENPFNITKEEELIKIVKQQIAIPSYIYVSREARDFLDKCLKKNPVDRVSIKQLVNHQFFIKNNEKNEKKLSI